MRTHLTRTLSPLLVAIAGLAAACGEKPAPKPIERPSSTTSATPTTPNAGGPKVKVQVGVTRTYGGVELAGHLRGSDSERADVLAAALELSDYPDQGAKGLINAKEAAHGVLVALLHSQSRNELSGAMEALSVLAADSSELKDQSREALAALLGHSLYIVREQAAKTISTLYDGDELSTLVSTLSAEQAEPLVPLLSQWDSPKIRATLVQFVKSPRAQLSQAAALALGHASRPVSPELIALARELLASPQSLLLSVELLSAHTPSDLAPLEASLLKAIDAGLASKESADVASAIRLLPTLTLGERLALQEQMAQDRRDDIRRMIAETLVSPASGESYRRLNALAYRLSEDVDGAVRLAGVRTLSALVAAQPASEHAALAPTVVQQLTKRLSDSNLAVRQATLAALAAPELAPAANEVLMAQYPKLEGELPGFLLEAMTYSKSRPQLEFVLSKLDGKPGWAQAHLALQKVSGQDFAPNAEAWLPWVQANTQAN